MTMYTTAMDVISNNVCSAEVWHQIVPHTSLSSCSVTQCVGVLSWKYHYLVILPVNYCK